MEAVKHAIEPQFLSQALSRGVAIRIGLMNKTEHEGIIREVGRYEINVEEKGSTVTILKQDISFLASHCILVPTTTVDEPSAEAVGAPSVHTKPNIQQEFLEKAIRERHVLTVFLLTGHRIKALLEDFDNFTLLVREGERQHLYYKHGISTINR